MNNIPAHLERAQLRRRELCLVLVVLEEEDDLGLGRGRRARLPGRGEDVGGRKGAVAAGTKGICRTW